MPKLNKYQGVAAYVLESGSRFLELRTQLTNQFIPLKKHGFSAALKKT